MQEILSVYLIRVFSLLEIRSVRLERNLHYEGIPTFAPEHFARVTSGGYHEEKAVCKGN